MSIEEIQTFKTSDGRIFEYLCEAEAHDERIFTEGAIAAFWREHAFDNMSLAELTSICMNNLDQLKDALRGAP